MRIVFINPPSGIGVGDWYFNLGVAHISSFLKQNGFKDIHYIEGTMTKYEDVLRKVKRLKPDIVGVSATTSKACSSYNLINDIKSRFDCTTIFGGVHATVMPDEPFEKSKVDIVVRGEGEQTMLEIVQGKPLRDILGLSYINNGKVQHNPERPFLEDLDSLPFPDRDLFPWKKYPIHYEGEGIGMILTARGCPYNCNFCISKNVWKRKVRFRSPKNFVDEIEHIMDKYGVKSFYIADDMLTISKKRVSSICDEIKERGLDISYKCYSRVDSINDVIAKMLKSSGCATVEFGIESGNQKILDIMNKGITLEQAKKAVKVVRDNGMTVQGDFIIGNYGDTEETIKETIEFAKSLRLFYTHFAILTPFPGSDVYEWLEKEGKIVSKNWDDYNFKKTVFKSDINLEYWYRRAWFEIMVNRWFVSAWMKKIIRSDRKFGRFKQLIKGEMIATYQYLKELAKNHEFVKNKK